MKTALISYHKNAKTIYPKEWIDEYRYSIIHQSRKDFDLYELDYGGGNFRVFENSNYHSKEFPTFVHALNYLLDCLFFMGYDCVLNTNVDDRNTLDRVEKQLPFIEKGFDIVSANFALINEYGDLVKTHSFSNLHIEQELSHNHNVICHPLVAYSKSFWQRNRYVPEQLPAEDLMLWQRGIKNSRFIILPDVLLFHRLHNQSVCQSENR